MVDKLLLNGNWEYKKSGDEKWNPIDIPGTVQQDLLKRKILPDYMKGLNEIYYYELEDYDWEFQKTFKITKEQLNKFEKVYLVFEGIDTFSEVYCNGRKIGVTNNMFIPFEFEVTKYLIEGENKIYVKIFSSKKEAKKRAKKNRKEYMYEHNSGRLFIRKAQYSFGWDWGPRISQIGIWREVYLKFVNTAQINNPFVKTLNIQKKEAELEFICDIYRIKLNTELELELKIKYKGKKVYDKRYKISARENIFRTKVLIKNPKLWYPNGMGDPNLYDVEIVLYYNQEIIDKKEIRTGIRIIELLEERDEEGKSFIIQINGEKVFCKGANWIPGDNLLPRVKEEDYKKYIELAKEAKMNILRVWGGGIYEDEIFYKLCDENGIMVWQDFMFACGEYPDEFKWFREEVKKEAEVVIKRLRNHPSIIVWCGNNECNWGLYLVYGKANIQYKGNYIYKKILPELYKKLDGTRIYRVSTPYGGKNPNDTSEGTSHLWDVWSSWENYDKYKEHNARFVSEFGFQGLPHPATISYFAKSKEQKIFNKVIVHHNKMYKGMERLYKFVGENFGIPKDFKSFIYLSQIMQGEAIKTGVEYWRSRKFKTAGTIYWQLNDVWPCISWSAVDYFKRKKALYYYTKRFYSDILPVIIYDEEKEKIYVKIVNDRLRSLRCKVELNIYSLSDGNKVFNSSYNASVRQNSVALVKKYRIEDVFKDSNTREDIYVKLASGGYTTYLVKKKDIIYNSIWFVKVRTGEEVFRNYFIPSRIRDLNIVKAKVEINDIREDEIEVSSRLPVIGCVIETEKEVDMSDNYLMIEPGERYRIKFSGNPGKVEVVDIREMLCDK